MGEKPIIVSSCLLGLRCAYDGVPRLVPRLVKLLEENKVVQVCPEQMGGMPTPRPKAEITKDNQTKVVSVDGKDVTENFQRGAEEALKIAKETGATKAVLKSRSPSCGCGKIYDGTFTKTLRDGDGITTQLFKKNGIKVMTDEEFLQRVRE